MTPLRAQSLIYLQVRTWSLFLNITHCSQRAITQLIRLADTGQIKCRLADWEKTECLPGPARADHINCSLSPPATLLPRNTINMERIPVGLKWFHTRKYTCMDSASLGLISDSLAASQWVWPHLPQHAWGQSIHQMLTADSCLVGLFCILIAQENCNACCSFVVSFTSLSVNDPVRVGERCPRGTQNNFPDTNGCL